MGEFSNVGTFLKKRRIEKGLTQADIGLALDLHPQYVSNWERGLCSPPMERLHLLIEVLKLNRRSLVEAMMKDIKVEVESRVYKNARKQPPSVA